MTDVTVQQPGPWGDVTVAYLGGASIHIEQGSDYILLAPAAIPALIAALQAAATEAEGRGDE